MTDTMTETNVIEETKEEVLTLAEALQELAQENYFADQYKESADTIMAAIQETDAWKDYEKCKEIYKKHIDRAYELREIVSNLTIQAFQETGNKKPAPGVGIRVYKSLKYNPDAALAWAKANNLDAAIQLNKSNFEKYAKGVADVMPLDFVEYLEEPKATISSDLSMHLWVKEPDYGGEGIPDPDVSV